MRTRKKFHIPLTVFRNQDFFPVLLPAFRLVLFVDEKEVFIRIFVRRLKYILIMCYSPYFCEPVEHPLLDTVCVKNYL
jgi:hypothetical protein